MTTTDSTEYALGCHDGAGMARIIETGIEVPYDEQTVDGFEFNGTFIHNPYWSECGRFSGSAVSLYSDPQTGVACDGLQEFLRRHPKAPFDLVKDAMYCYVKMKPMKAGTGITPVTPPDPKPDPRAVVPGNVHVLYQEVANRCVAIACFTVPRLGETTRGPETYVKPIVNDDAFFTASQVAWDYIAQWDGADPKYGVFIWDPDADGHGPIKGAWTAAEPFDPFYDISDEELRWYAACCRLFDAASSDIGREVNTHAAVEAIVAAYDMGQRLDVNSREDLVKLALEENAGWADEARQRVLGTLEEHGFRKRAK